ncbi:hypothetical protein Bca4012_065415 [Brassica carinata]
MDLVLPPDLPDPPGENFVSKEIPVESLTRDVIRSNTVRIEEGKKVESWVQVAQDKKVLKKHTVEILKKDGANMVEIPDEFHRELYAIMG